MEDASQVWCSIPRVLLSRLRALHLISSPSFIDSILVLEFCCHAVSISVSTFYQYLHADCSSSLTDGMPQTPLPEPRCTLNFYSILSSVFIFYPLDWWGELRNRHPCLYFTMTSSCRSVSRHLSTHD